MSAVQTTKMTNWRWVMCAMLFFATTVNYLDRQVLSLTFKEFIQPEFHWTDSDYGTITGVFSIAYAIFCLFAGKFVDWMGTKKGYLIAIVVWSLGAVLHAGCGWVAVHFVDGVADTDAISTPTAATAGTRTSRSQLSPGSRVTYPSVMMAGRMRAPVLALTSRRRLAKATFEDVLVSAMVSFPAALSQLRMSAFSLPSGMVVKAR